MILIRFFSSFCDSNNVSDIYYRLCLCHLDKEYGKTYSFVKDDTYTHAVIQNTAMPNLKIPKENVLGLAFEPIEFLGLTNEFIEYAKKHIGKYYIGVKGNLPEPFIEHFSYMWHNPRPENPPKKTKKMSVVFSQKQQAPGHIYRLELIKEILKTSLPIDIYGFGCKLFEGVKDDRLKGEFIGIEPFVEYEYHICIENYRHPLYISEKFMDPVIFNTVPIYLGAYNIDDLFPDSCIHLSGNLKSDMNLISNIASGKMLCDLKVTYPEGLKFNEAIKKIFLGHS